MNSEAGCYFVPIPPVSDTCFMKSPIVYPEVALMLFYFTPQKVFLKLCILLITVLKGEMTEVLQEYKFLFNVC